MAKQSDQSHQSGKPIVPPKVETKKVEEPKPKPKAKAPPKA